MPMAKTKVSWNNFKSRRTAGTRLVNPGCLNSSSLVLEFWSGALIAAHSTKIKTRLSCLCAFPWLLVMILFLFYEDANSHLPSSEAKPQIISAAFPLTNPALFARFCAERLLQNNPEFCGKSPWPQVEHITTHTAPAQAACSRGTKIQRAFNHWKTFHLNTFHLLHLLLPNTSHSPGQSSWSLQRQACTLCLPMAGALKSSMSLSSSKSQTRRTRTPRSLHRPVTSAGGDSNGTFLEFG